MCQEALSALPSSGESCAFKEMQVVAQKILKERRDVEPSQLKILPRLLLKSSTNPIKRGRKGCSLIS